MLHGERREWAAVDLRSSLEARVALVARLRARRSEIDGAIFARVSRLGSLPVASGDGEYVDGLRAASVAAVDYALAGIEGSGCGSAKVPPAVLEQARRAACTGIGLDTVLRRYVAGYGLLEEAIVEETERSGLAEQGRPVLRDALQIAGALVDRLIGEVSGAYRQEVRRIAAGGGRFAPSVRRGAARGRSGDAGVARARLLEVFVELAAQTGFERLSVGVLVRRARVSRRTFYGLFPGGLHECLLAALDEGTERGCELAARRLGEGGCQQEAVRGALAALLVFFDCEPALARVCFVEALSGGREVAEHRERCVARFRALIVSYFEAQAGRADALAAEGTVAAVMGVIYNRLLTRDERPLIELLGPLMGIVAASGGVSEASVDEEVRRGQELARAIQAGAPGWRPTARPRSAEVGGESAAPLPELLVRPGSLRARECLLYVAEQHRRGREPSNRGIAAAIGVAHRSQISRLLAQLAGEGLLAKRSGGPGAANAWRLTAHGARVVEIVEGFS